MKKAGKTIQIFLPDGNPRSIKIAEITSRTVSAIHFHRSKLLDATKRDELNNVGIYLLFDSDELDPKVYIGEAENCLNRIKQHNKSKDFWSHAIAFISKTQFFTKTHIKYLEWLCCETAKKANRYSLDNSNTPTKPHLSESVEADLFDNFENIKVLASTLGYPVFDEVKKSKSNEIIVCKGKDAYAKGEYTEEGLIVFSGSTCNLEESESASSWIINTRKKLKDSGVLVEKNGVLEFLKDHIFNSPTGAATVVLGRNANGWGNWKYNDGKTLDEVKRKS